MITISQLLSSFPGECSVEVGIAYFEGCLSGAVFIACAFALKGLRKW